MRRITQLAIASLLTLGALPVWGGDIYSSVYTGAATASRFQGDDKLTEASVRVGGEFEWYRDAWSITLNGYAQHDYVYDIHAGYSELAEDEYQTQLWIDDAYISWRADAFTASLGYQKVVWGQADDFQITDVVNPLDYQNFVLFDIDEYRKSLPMLRVQIPTDQWELGLVWVMATEPDLYPKPGSEFDLGYLESINDNKPAGSEVGLSAQGFLDDYDLSFYSFYGYNDAPVTNYLPNGAAEYAYHRETMVGSSLAKPIGGWVLRGELALNLNREHDTWTGELADHTVADALVGLDYLHGDWLFTAQLADSWITDYDESIVMSEHNAFYTLAADANLMAATLALRVAVSYAAANGDGALYQTKLTYKPDANWRFQLNLDVLAGDEANFFGQFNNKDRLWFSINYTF